MFTTVFFGANDAALPGELQHAPEDVYGKNLAAIVKGMRNSFKKRRNEATISSPEEMQVPVILFTPPPVDVDAWYMERGSPKDEPNDRANENAKRYGDVVKRVGKEISCSVLDVFTLLGGDESVKHYGKHMRDGLHLSESGNELVHEGLMRLLQTDHPHLLPMLDGEGKRGSSGVPLEGRLWREMCSLNENGLESQG